MSKISYLVSSYDSGQYLDQHLSNLLEQQSDPDLEVIIVVPNSPGTDAAIATKWAAKDHRINFIEWPEREPYGTSWLRAWTQARSPFVCNSNHQTKEFENNQLAHLYFEELLWDQLFVFFHHQTT